MHTVLSAAAVCFRAFFFKWARGYGIKRAGCWDVSSTVNLTQRHTRSDTVIWVLEKSAKSWIVDLWGTWRLNP